MKNLPLYSILICLIATIIVIKNPTPKVVVIPPESPSKTPVAIIGQDTAYLTIERVPFGSSPDGLFYKGKPTEKQKKYFLEHK